MKQAQFSIDVSAALLESGAIPASRRAVRFVARAFRTNTRRFSAPWLPAGYLDVALRKNSVDALLVLNLPKEAANVGDRIQLVASVVSEEDTESIHGEHEDADARLFDGAAMFVLHFLDRADPLTREHLVGIRPPRDTPEVSSPEDREVWRILRDRTVQVMVENEIRGPASLQALISHINGLGADLTLLDDRNEPVKGVNFLEEVVGARRIQRKRSRPVSAEGIFEVTTGRSRVYQPMVDARELLRTLSLLGQTFGTEGDAPSPDEAERILREIAFGTPASDPRLRP